MAHPLAIFRFSEGVRFASGIGTIGGLCVVGYSAYTYAYYHYLGTKAQMSSTSSTGNGGSPGPSS